MFVLKFNSAVFVCCCLAFLASESSVIGQWLKEIKNSWINIAFDFIKAFECEDDEQCLAIEECEEYKYVLSRNFEKIRLKVCGLMINTVNRKAWRLWRCFVLEPILWTFQREHCCKVSPSISESDTTAKNSSKETQSLLNHPNYAQINHKKCGRSDAFRIVGGEIAKIGQFPWMALLRYSSSIDDTDLSFKCGGTLITVKHVLTVSHCIRLKDSNLWV